MSGKDLRNFLYLNGISQDEAAKLLGVKRQTINNWYNKEDLKGNILTKSKFIIVHFSAKISETNISGVVINGNAKDVDIKNTNDNFTAILRTCCARRSRCLMSESGKRTRR